MSITPQIFETIMLICFGSSWPFAIMKSLRTRCVNGKSIIFLFLIFCGYIAGITYKLLANFDQVIWLYMLNSSMIMTEILLYFKYRRLSHSQGTDAETQQTQRTVLSEVKQLRTGDDEAQKKRPRFVPRLKEQGSTKQGFTQDLPGESTDFWFALKPDFSEKKGDQNFSEYRIPPIVKLVATLCALFIYYYQIFKNIVLWEDAAAMAAIGFLAVCIGWIAIAALSGILFKAVRYLCLQFCHAFGIFSGFIS